jgi:Leucine Rich repeat
MTQISTQYVWREWKTFLLVSSVMLTGLSGCEKAKQLADKAKVESAKLSEQAKEEFNKSLEASKADFEKMKKGESVVEDKPFVPPPAHSFDTKNPAAVLDYFRKLNSVSITDADIKLVADLPAAAEQLTELKLNGARGVGAGLALISKFVNLRLLDMTSVTKYTPGLEAATQLQKLESLAIGGMATDDESMKLVGQIKSLKSLDIHSTVVSDAGLPHLKDLRLEQFLIHDTSNITGSGFEFMSLEALRELKAANSRFGEAGCKHLAGATQLAFIDMNQCNASDDSLRELSACTAIKQLQLSRNREITDTGVKHLAKLRNLESLVLEQDAQITDRGIVALKPLKKLKFLDVHMVGLGPGLSELKKAIPALEIKT